MYFKTAYICPKVRLYKVVIVPFQRENGFQCASTESNFSLGITYDCYESRSQLLGFLRVESCQVILPFLHFEPIERQKRSSGQHGPETHCYSFFWCPFLFCLPIPSAACNDM